jgi:hypothetical protein
MTKFSEPCCVIRFEIDLHLHKVKIKKEKKKLFKTFTLCGLA